MFTARQNNTDLRELKSSVVAPATVLDSSLKSGQQEPFKQSALFGLLLAQFIVVFSVHLLFAVFVSSPLDHVYSDMELYLRTGWRFAFERNRLEPFDFFTPVGASYVFGLCFTLLGQYYGLVAAALWQPLALSCASVLTTAIGLLVYKNWRVASVAGLAAGLYPPLIGLSGFFLSEPTFILLLLLGQLLCLLGLLRSESHPATERHSSLGVTEIALLMLSGFVLGCSALVKTQGVAVLAGAAFISLLYSRSIFVRFTRGLAMLLGGAVPILLQFWVNSTVLGHPTLFISSNDAFNVYLGQSRHRGVGGLDPQSGAFHIFFNDNGAFDHTLSQPEGVAVALWDRDYFFSRTAELWQQSPTRQLFRSLQSAVDLHVVEPYWPFRNLTNTVPVLIFATVFMQGLFVPLVILPALVVLIAGLCQNILRRELLFLALPLLLISIVTTASHGDPRFRLPFEYNLFLLAAPFYGAVIERRQKRQSFPSQHHSKVANSWSTVGLAVGRFEITRGIVALGTCFLVGAAITAGYAASSPVAQPSAEGHYWSIYQPGSAAPILWQEFGKSSSINPFPLPKAHTVQLRGFRTGSNQKWLRTVNWFVETENEGEISINFPSSAPGAVSLFLTDGDAGGRIVQVESSGQTVVASNLLVGKWVTIPITDVDRNSGSVKVVVRRLNGPSAAVSAVALLPERF